MSQQRMPHHMTPSDLREAVIEAARRLKSLGERIGMGNEKFTQDEKDAIRCCFDGQVKELTRALRIAFLTGDAEMDADALNQLIAMKADLANLLDIGEG